MNKTAQEVVSYIDVTGRALAVAAAEIKTAEEVKKAAGERVTPLVDAMIAHGLIKESDRKAASEQLASHPDALDITLNVVEEMADRLKQANAKISALNNGQAVEESGSTKKAGKTDEDADLALIGLVPSLAGKYNS